MRALMAINPTDPDRRASTERLEPDFRLVVTARLDNTVVVPQGELDLATAPELDAVLVAHTGRVVVDLREVSFADAAALHVLLRAEARSRADGMNLTFIAGHAVERLIEVLGLPDPLTFVEPPAASDAALPRHLSDGDQR